MNDVREQIERQPQSLSRDVSVGGLLSHIESADRCPLNPGNSNLTPFPN